MDYDAIINEFDSKLFDSLSKSSNRTFFFASNIKEDRARWSKGAVEYFGLGSEILCPADAQWAKRIHPDDFPVYLEDFEKMANHVSAYHDCEYRMLNADGEYVWVNCKGYMTYDNEGQMDFFAGFVTNLGVRNKIDPVTEMWTIQEFRRDVENRLYKNQKGAAVLIGLSNFKRVNDEYGYSYGDKVLYCIAHKILDGGVSHARLYRMDGSDFALLIDNGTREDVIKEIERIEQVFEDLYIEQKLVHVDFKAGAVLFPQDGKYIDQLMSNMTIALENAKNSGVTDVVFFTEEMYLEKTRILRLKDAIRECVNDSCKDFHIVMQPIMDAHSGECQSCEVLLRWNSEDFPGTGPMEFVPILESTGLIIPVGKWVIEEGLRYLKKWDQSGTRLLEKIHVNLSYLQLQDEFLADFTAERLREYGIEPERLVLELTESCRIGRIDDLLHSLQKFRDYGISIALDDFGTGYSSLAVLKDIPADIVKIDHTMIKSVLGTEKEKRFIELIISFCNDVGITVCAEGVENAAIMNIVKEAGATLLQGYHFDRPLSADEFYNKYVK